MSQKELSKMTVPELKEILKGKNLPVDGKKAELIERIQVLFSQNFSVNNRVSTLFPHRYIINKWLLSSKLTRTSYSALTTPTSPTRRFLVSLFSSDADIPILSNFVRER